MMHGWLDLARVTAAPATCSLEPAADGTRIIRGPGLEVAIRDASAMALARGPLALVVQGASPAVRQDAGAHQELLDAFRSDSRAAQGRLGDRYALVFIDLEARHAVLATDRFAAIPLCYSADGLHLAFSDRADNVPLRRARSLSRQAIYEYLYFHFVPAPHTVFEGVSRLDLAERLDFDARGVRISTHWTPEFREFRHDNLDALKAEFRGTLLEAVEQTLREEGEWGCFLSGGTDSSTLAGMMTRALGRPARTYSIGFDAEGYDEVEYARIAARHFGTEHTEYYLTPQDLIEGIPRLATHFDQPFGNSSAVPAYQCARVAREAGVTRMLAGDGGDELFGGNTRYARQRVFAAYDNVPNAVRRLMETALLDTPGVRRLPVAGKAASYVAQARVPMPDRMNSYNLLTRLDAARVLTPEFLAEVDADAVRRQQREVYERSRGASLVDRMLAYDWKYTLADNDLPKVREATRLAGTGVAFPFLADSLLDFSLKIGADLKVKGVQLRYFFKEALRGFLPEEVITKKKHGFGLPFGVWLTKHEPLHAFAKASLEHLNGLGIVRPRFTEELMGSTLREHPGYYGEMVWILMMLGLWLEHAESGRSGRAREEKAA